jgi:hypothetical protein
MNNQEIQKAIASLYREQKYPAPPQPLVASLADAFGELYTRIEKLEQTVAWQARDIEKLQAGRE